MSERTTQTQSQAQYLDIPIEDEGQMLTVEEAAAYLGIDAKQIPALASQFGLPRRYIVQPRNAWVYDSADLDRMKPHLPPPPAKKQAAETGAPPDQAPASGPPPA